MGRGATHLKCLADDARSASCAAAVVDHPHDVPRVCTLLQLGAPVATVLGIGGVRWLQCVRVVVLRVLRRNKECKKSEGFREGVGYGTADRIKEEDDGWVVLCETREVV